MQRVDPLEFFGLLRWIDGRPLLDTMEEFRQRAFQEFYLTAGSDGLPRYNLGLFMRAKKNWKSADLILHGFYNLCQPCPHGQQCYVVANDEDQAADDLDLAKKLVKANPALQSDLLVKQKVIERRDGDGFMEILPSDAIGSHGKTFAFVGFDELWGYRDWSMLEALQPDPSRPEAVTVICTYAGYDQRAGIPLWDLFQAGKKGTDPGLYFSCYEGDEANPSSIVTPEYLEQQRIRLPWHIYQRLHRNVWTSGMGGLWSMEEWDACVDSDHRPLLPTKGVPLSIGVDASTKRDRTACVGVYRDGDRIKLAFSKFWQPSFLHPMDLEATLEKFLLEVRDNYSVSVVRYDVHQFHRSAMTLKGQGLPMEEYVQSVPNLEAMAQSLFDSVKGRTLVLYEDQALREEAGMAVGKVTSNEKFYISKEKSGHKIDQVVALAMAVHVVASSPVVNPEAMMPWAGGQRQAWLGAETDEYIPWTSKGTRGAPGRTFGDW